MFDLEKLTTQIDINNLDADQLSRLVSEHQNSFLKLFVVVVSLFLAAMMFNNYHAKDQEIRTKMTHMKEKIQAINESKASVLALDKFKATIPPKINESDLIDMISNFAKSYNIIITSLSPAESKDMGIYDVIDVNFNSASDSFKDMMLFLRKIEKSDVPLMINSWNGHEELDGRITFTIEVSAVIIHT